MSRQIVLDEDQIEKALKGSGMSQKEFMKRLVIAKSMSDKEKLQVGQYWQWERVPYAVFRIDYRVKEGHEEFGIKYLNGQTGQYLGSEIRRDGHQITDKQLSDALQFVAKDNGFTKPVTVNGLDGNRHRVTQQGIDKYGFTYDEDMEALFFGNVLIYIQGDWAEVVEEKWEVRQRDSEHYVADSKGDRVWMNAKLSYKQATAIKDALNKLEEV